MRKNLTKDNINIVTYDELLGGEEEIRGDITEISLKELHTFKGHPFHVVDDEKMQDLVESIKEKGVLSPAIVRKREKGGYEIISGHRRKRACEIAGLSTMPVIIKDLDDNDATILMVDANIQRENILPSERAFSLQMKLNAIKRQGKRTDLTSDHFGPKLEEDETSSHSDQKLAADRVGDKEGSSASVVRRDIRLTYLIPGILDRVDSGKIGFMQAVDLSFIDKDNQKIIYAVVKKTDRKMTSRQAKMLRSSFESGTLDEDEICDILIGKTALIRTVTFTEKELSRYFPDDMDSVQVKEAIINLLEKRKEALIDG